MKQKALLILVGGALLALGATWLYGSQPPLSRPTLNAAAPQIKNVQPAVTTPTPTVGTPSLSPSMITVNTPSTVTIVVSISPVPTAGGANLLRLGAIGTQPTVLGVMHDDGKNGDAVAGDSVYTLQVPFNESQAGQVQLQVSAAFQSTLKRAISPIIALAVWQPLSTLQLTLNYPPGTLVVNNNASSTSIQTSAQFNPTGASPSDVAPITTEGFQFTIETDPPVVGLFNINVWLSKTSPLWQPSIIQTTSVGTYPAYLIPPEDPTDYTTIIVPATSFVYVITYNMSYFTDAANAAAQTQIGTMLSSIKFK